MAENSAPARLPDDTSRAATDGGLRTARCACGQLRIVCEGVPENVSACHCLECKRRTGSAFGAAVFYNRDKTSTSGISKIFARQRQRILRGAPFLSGLRNHGVLVSRTKAYAGRCRRRLFRRGFPGSYSAGVRAPSESVAASGHIGQAAAGELVIAYAGAAERRSAIVVLLSPPSSLSISSCGLRTPLQATD